MMKTAFGDDCLSDQLLIESTKAFLRGREEISYEARAGWPSTTTTDENVTRVRELLNSESGVSTQEETILNPFNVLYRSNQ